MKIKEEHYQQLKAAFEKLVSQKGVEILTQHKTGLKTDPRVKNLDKRFRWDCFWLTKRLGNFKGEFLDELYKYVDDTHIDTALKRVVKELKL